MIRWSHLKRLTLGVTIFALAGCCHPATQSKYMGNPENPYPSATEPKVGDIVHMPTGIKLSLPQMLDIAADARVVYVGETHDNPASHRLELQTLQGLEERHPGQVALGMEMFSRSQQPVLDRWSKGELDEKTFLKEVRWFDNWKMDFDYYRDLLLFARDRHIPVLGLNAEKNMVQAVRNKQPDQLTAQEKAQLPEMDLTDQYQRGMVTGIFHGHSHAEMHIEGFIRAQTLWDETMAETAARFLASPAGKGRHLMVVAGGHHISYGFGIPRRVFRRIPASYATIGGTEIVVARETEPQTMDVELPRVPMVPYTFLAYLAYEELPKQEVLLGVAYEPAASGHGLKVNEVVPGSNAEKAGVKKGDVILSIDGQALSDSYDLVYAIKHKHPGDHGTLQVERDGKVMTLEVLFQGAPAARHGSAAPVPPTSAPAKP